MRQEPDRFLVCKTETRGGSHLDIFSYCSIYGNFIIFLSLFKLIKFWATPIITKCTDTNFLIQRQKTAWTGIWPWILQRGRHSFLANSAAAPSRAFVCSRAFSFIFLFFSFPVLDSCLPNEPNSAHPLLGHRARWALHDGNLALGTQEEKESQCQAMPKCAILSGTICMTHESSNLQ